MAYIFYFCCILQCVEFNVVVHFMQLSNLRKGAYYDTLYIFIMLLLDLWRFINMYNAP